MCGAIYNVNDHPALPGVLSELGYSQDEIDRITGTMIKRRDLRPTDPVLGLIPTKQGKEVMQAVWWLKLDRESLKPDTKWATFNSRSRSILSSKLHTIPPKSYRSIVFARGFFEWQPVYPGGLLHTELSEEEQQKPPKPMAKHRFLIHQPGKVMLLGALCKHWLHEDGRPLVSTSIITLPPHPGFLDIHAKSFPLVLNWDELDTWLDPKTQHEAFTHLFNSNTFREEFEAIPVDEPNFEPVGEPVILKPS